ncbi:MAG TPA: tetratricopeptide repeat protein [Bacteroidota bacterium]|nr:tetratricopeptide repeat protein [Bacteroidota bacterium]
MSTSQRRAGHRKQGAEASLSPRRKRLFLIVTVLFPFVLLALVEGALHAFDYGGDLRLVIERRIGDKTFYSINRSVARRYFAQAGTIIPEPADDVFEIVKRKNTKRIFCLGESTMAGFPYEFNTTAPGFLRDRLQTLLPQYNVEVINVGLSAVGSFVVLDFINELINYEPDLFVLYVGHNEFYGAYGAGSRVAMGGSSTLTRLTLQLLEFKTFLVLRDGYFVLRRWLSSGPSPSGNATLMGQMVGEQIIPYGSSLYRQAREAYRENLERIIAVAQGRGIPILVSTLVSNVKDHPPFESVFGEKSDEATRVRWRQLVSRGDTLARMGNLPAAADRYREALLLDSANAEAYFKLGRMLYDLKMYPEARGTFLRAKDLDALRFRMTEEFQNDMLRVCAERGVVVARVDSAFAANSPQGIIGNELILEHLHPNINGYFLMAKTWCRAIMESNVLVPRSEWQLDRDLTDVEYMKLSTASPFDSTVGKLKIDLLMRKWPFQKVEKPFTFAPSNAVERLAYAYVQGSLAWSDARYALAEAYAAQGEFDHARRECMAVSKVIPFSYNPLLRVADYYALEGRMAEAKAGYWRCVQTEDNPFARMKLGWRYLEEDKPDSALQQLQLAFEVNERFYEKLTLQGQASGRYLLAVAYAKLGNFPEARQQLERALAIQPDYTDARELLQQLQGR